MSPQETLILPLEKVSMADIASVGGKNASLGEMIQTLIKTGVPVTGGYAITVAAYKKFIRQEKLEQKINQLISKINIKDIENLKNTSQEIKKLINETALPVELTEALMKAYDDYKIPSAIVRSSATAEDLPNASFAGQQESFLNVSSMESLLVAVKEVYASLFSSRSISYRIHNNIDSERVYMSVAVQPMIRSDKAASGVIFTLDTESGFDRVILINASYGLGETIVKGQVNPDEFYVYKTALENNKVSILRKILGEKAIKMILSANTQHRVETINTPLEERNKFCISDVEIQRLANYAMKIEKHFGYPVDIEWAKDGVTQELFVVQARPETIKSRQKNLPVIEHFHLQESGIIKAKGRSIGERIGQGPAALVLSPKELHNIKPGDVLVTEMTDPDWEPVMKEASAIVTDRGGRTCHAAIVARELNIPAVVGCGDATKVINSGDELTVSCAEGELGKVYQGLLKYSLEKISIADLPKPPIKLCLNLGNPDKAFQQQSLPNHGVGLARLEFIISDMIGIHPNALLNFENLSIELQDQIKPRISGYPSPKEFYIEKLREGISTIAAAFFPKEVIFRFSDFKSNEYANLTGGKLYEPIEENPMLGFRGAARYLDIRFSEAFALECEALVRVRKMGLSNAQIMVPFVRTVEEIKKVTQKIEINGLKRSDKTLKVYMMCEIPSNIILASEFLKYVDGFSIGSNDLTQLCLGVDRDSEIIAPLFDEQNDAVKALLKQVIELCNRENKYIGICGQGPSDHPEFAEWLVKTGIQSISLNADSIVKVWMLLSGREQQG